jgi:hypothetical protein
VALYNVLGNPEIWNGLPGTLFKRTASLLDYPEMISVVGLYFSVDVISTNRRVRGREQ